MNKQSILYTIIFTFVVSFIFVTVLALANTSTEEQVALNQQLNRQRAILNALNVEYNGAQEVLRKFENVDQVDRNGMTLFRTRVEGETVFAKEFTGSGLWGEINGILAVTQDLDRTVGLEILSHNETPGLGGRIDEPWFKQQFRNERIVDGTVDVTSAGDGDTNHDNGEVDAITGASRTSDSMRTIISAELSTLSSVLGGNS